MGFSCRFFRGVWVGWLLVVSGGEWVWFAASLGFGWVGVIYVGVWCLWVLGWGFGFGLWVCGVTVWVDWLG